MTISAKIICDSTCPQGTRLTTFLVTIPRFILAEVLTHRAFSRNSSSSRAIPFSRKREAVEKSPAMPLEFRKNQPGMQAKAELVDDPAAATTAWLEACGGALTAAEKLNALGAHKQYVNRLIEPFSYETLVITATEYNNFFYLRYSKHAQPEIAELAKLMYNAYVAHTPVPLYYNEYHLPFISIMEKDNLPLEQQIKCSVARCARTSYWNHDKTDTDIEKDCALYDRLLKDSHLSPFEHVGRPLDVINDEHSTLYAKYGKTTFWSGNFKDWYQYRKSIQTENTTEFIPPEDF